MVDASSDRVVGSISKATYVTLRCEPEREAIDRKRHRCTQMYLLKLANCQMQLFPCRRRRKRGGSKMCWVEGTRHEAERGTRQINVTNNQRILKSTYKPLFKNQGANPVTVITTRNDTECTLITPGNYPVIIVAASIRNFSRLGG